MGQLAEHIANHPFLVAGLVAMLVGVAFFEFRQRAQGQNNVSAADAVKLINKGAVVIDVRKPADYQAGHIVNSKNVELSEVRPDQAVLKKQKNKVLITVCDNGFMSSRAAALLRKAGFDKVFSLKGGLNGWRAENLPLVK
ncbi:MAG: rhodanese-like domain-containing protein [Gammaproteobacteria bacterium]|nr:rhodanese-like domain-containing protein [Gammaproteobacteria bacterium]